MTIRVAIVEDHPIFREGLASALRDEGVTVVDAVGSVSEALVLTDRDDIDVVLLDLGLPDGSGLDVLSTLQTHRPNVAVIVLTMAEDRPTMLAALQAGVRGYLLKGASRTEIADAVRRAHAGGAVLDRAAADVALGALASSAPGSGLGLTAREDAVLRLLAADLGNQAIADRLGVSAKTARNQVSAVLTKLGVPDRRAAGAKARALGY